ncbi:MAG TPA: hypothetical protein VFO25_13780 [Candidatus Eremiobacteraceae bacterium]|nr:hypothetical protein [Candidatus Eremiobacteraceae bacterium]
MKRGAARRSAGDTAGYSAKPLVEKLGIKPGHLVLIRNAPRGYATTLGNLPLGALRYASGKGPFDVIQVFVSVERDLRPSISAARVSMKRDGMVWVSWPKKSSGRKTDIDENDVRHAGLALDLVDVKICAVDDVWSGLKFVIPVKLR